MVMGAKGGKVLEATFLGSMAEIDAAQWDGLFRSKNPFVSHAFLEILESSGSANADSGWRPMHLVLRQSGCPVAAMPLYLKDHSYGEFVFDWGWADAFQRHGLDYYPKLLTAIPFTPSTGPRLGIARDVDPEIVTEAAVKAIMALAKARGLSSWHLLFPEAMLRSRLDQHDDLMMRQDIQFHWRNRGFDSFDDFLASLRSRRRKNMKRERRAVQEQGVGLVRKSGADISKADQEAFYQCYLRTYLKRSGHGGYLTWEFFQRLFDEMNEQLLLVVAERDDATVATALFLFDDEALYGRYWGSLERVNCLHFEACFYQGIEFCIERGLQRFDPGTQGEHKLMRGFEPITTQSCHWVANEQFRLAIGDFLDRERRATEQYGQRAADFLPFRRD